MLNELPSGLKIFSVHTLSWEKQRKYAYPRSFNAISLRIEGQAEFTHNERTFKVNKNEIIFVPKNYGYTITSLIPEKVIVIHFDSDTDYSEIETFVPTDRDIFISLFNQIERVYSAQNAGHLQKIYALFYEILEQIQIQTKNSATNQNLFYGFDKSVDYLNRNLSASELSVRTLANIANVSEVYYRKIFKKMFGISPCKYLTRMRLQKARTLLKTGYYTVEQVSFDCGFNDAKYFSTCYKKRYGNSPGKDIEKLFKNI